MYSDDQKIKRKKTGKKGKKRSFFINPLSEETYEFMGELEKTFVKLLWGEIFSSLVLIIVGMIFYFYSEASTIFIGILLGILFIGIGLLQLLAYTKRKKIPLYKFSIYYSGLNILLGVLTILNPFTFTKVATFMVGIWLICVAIIKVDHGLRLKLIEEKSWLFLILSSALTLFMGITLLINPFNNLLLTEIIGSFLILYGILDITDALMLKKRAKAFLENF